MPKNLVLFSDGTGNSAGKLFKTNVWRLYQAVDLTDPRNPQRPRQFAFYDDGVGTSSFKPLALVGGAFGVGLARNVVDLYIFLCRMYQPGDQIYAFGFSRGAFTIRVLIGLVMTEGLLRYSGSETELQRLGWDAYRAYRRKSFQSNRAVEMLRSLRDLVLDGKNRIFGHTLYKQAKRIGRPDPTPESGDPITVRFLGLWDTVDAYGLPVEQLTRAIDRWLWPLTMRDYNLKPRVLRARQALSLDDERDAFHPRLWNEVPDPAKPDSGVPGANEHTHHIDQERVSQVWFAGVHGNVGGGYPDDSLSYVPLQWIMTEAAKYGLRFEPNIWADLVALSDENGKLYDSRRGVASYYAYKPRRIDRLDDTKDVKIARTKVHESVLRRIKVDPDGYAPIVLPPRFAVMRIDGAIVDAQTYISQMNQHPGSPLPPPANWLSHYAVAREAVFKTVGWRRVAYFMTLLVSLVLLVMPAFAPGNQACQEVLCFLTKPITLLDHVLPSFASPWTESFASHPMCFLVLIVLLAVCMKWGTWLDSGIKDKMRRAWYSVAPLKPDCVYEMPASGLSGQPAVARVKARSHLLPHAVFHFLSDRFLPGAFVLGILVGGGIFFTQIGFSIKSSAGAVCQAPGPDRGDTGSYWFDPRERCSDSGLNAREGATYRVAVAVPVNARWGDKKIPASPHGFECPLSALQAALMTVMVPARRHLTEKWFQPMARIGVTGDDTYALNGVPSTPALKDRCPKQVLEAKQVAQGDASCPTLEASIVYAEVYESIFVARSSGPLFFYVNDVVGVPFFDQYFYENNSGCARISVTRLPDGVRPAGI